MRGSEPVRRRRRRRTRWRCYPQGCLVARYRQRPGTRRRMVLWAPCPAGRHATSRPGLKWRWGRQTAADHSRWAAVQQVSGTTRFAERKAETATTILERYRSGETVPLDEHG